MTNPRVLVAIQHYLPGIKSGGPVRSVANLIEQLGDTFDFRVVTLDRDFKDNSAYPGIEPGAWHPVGKANVLYLDRSSLRPQALRPVISKLSFDLLYINGIYPTIAISLLLLRRLDKVAPTPALVAPRGHLEPGALSIKPLKKTTFLKAGRSTGLFRGLWWHASSASEEKEIIHEIGERQSSRIRVIPNPVDLESPRLSTAADVKQPSRLRMVYLSRISPMKNLNLLLKCLTKVQEQIELDLFGPLEDSDYWNECQTVIGTVPANVTVRYRGEVPASQVQQMLAGYHLFALPTLGENFGHVIFEALSAGCPVLISDRTPWNRVQDAGAGWALSLDNPDAFRDVIEKVARMDEETWARHSQRARAFAEEYVAASTATDDMRAFLMELATNRFH